MFSIILYWPVRFTLSGKDNLTVSLGSGIHITPYKNKEYGVTGGRYEKNVYNCCHW